MTSQSSDRPVSALRARMIEDMSVRGFSEKTRSDYIRNVRAFAAFLGRAPDSATAEDLRRFQLHQTQSGMQPPSVCQRAPKFPQKWASKIPWFGGEVLGR
jgi:integrase/recombinase XerD